ncbi:hypothetical protein JXB41_03965 [Candidatus Woesearchaeota archaeon]|nr:hypothetical protein [Candidatus Woesearchaeota archaeon]
MKHDSGSLSNVIKDIEKDIIKSKKEMFNELDKQIKEEKNQLKQELKKEYNKRVREGKIRITEEISYISEKNELDNKRKLLNLKRELFDNFMELIYNELIEFRKDRKYSILLKKQINYFKKKFKSITVWCNEKDINLLRKIDKKINVKSDNEIIIGIIIEDKNKSQKVDLTLDRLLESKKKYFSENLFKRLSK